MGLLRWILLLERVRDILFKPKETWHQLKDESISFGHVFTDYAMPLAAIPVIFGMLGYMVVGIRSGFGTHVYRFPFGTALVWAIINYVLTLIGLVVLGILINGFSRVFDSEHHAVNAFKLAVFSYTPAFIAGVLNIVPTLGFIVFLISLYGIYLLFCGLPIMMDTPREKVAGYIVSIIVSAVVINVIVWGISGIVLSIP